MSDAQQPGPPERVAVIVVHGIADQVRGDTGADVAAQLAAGWHASVGRCDIPLAVTPVDPAVPFERWNPKGWTERSAKALRQSLRSDFLDARLGERPAATLAPGQSVPLRSSAAHDGPRGADGGGGLVDQGVRFTDYLLAKAASVREGAGTLRHYEMACHQVRAPGRHADVYEMYWADLSRLGGNVTRILAELFTLLFHLSKLGVDTVSLADVATPPSIVRRALARAHRWANWVFSRVLALLFLQLLVVALVLVPAALVVGRERGAGLGGAVLAGALVALGWVYVARRPWVEGVWAGGVSGGLLAWAAWAQPGVAAWAVLLGGLALLLWVYRAFLGYCEERFRAVYGVGLVLMAVTLASIAWGAATHDTAGAGPRLVAGGLRAVEVLLLLQLSAWVLMAGLVAAAVGLGEASCRGEGGTAPQRQSVVTARLGLFVSMGIFVAVVMTVWALVSRPLEALVEGLHYAPWWFADATVDGRMQAARFLALRFTASTDTFAVVAAMLLALLGFVGLVFLPSVLVELRLAGVRSAARLGHWLTAGYRALDRLVRWWSWLITVALLGVAVLLVGSQLARLGIALPWLGEVSLPVGTWSGDLLTRLVVVIASGAVGLVAIGGVAVKRLKALRAPLDAALDVDNHFREFPRQAIPRVLIFERYVALLEHVLAQGHERVVIVAHSQGTVITADLLRYLQRRDRLQPAASAGDRLVTLGRRLGAARVRLLTAGSPLRQLYALRFPWLYRWVLGRGDAQPEGERGDARAPLGPDPRADLGVAHWVNVWGAGDYVGRWLWSAAHDPALPPLAVDDAAYDGVPTQQAPVYRDLCLGPEAHTHYFELDNEVMLAELRALV
ncbi:MAG: hypothetical protein KF891_23330 [Rhizobacter sp.]|nr:hypothetical protein [Rhizobacter sp.]